MAGKPGGLGRGLGALIPKASAVAAAAGDPRPEPAAPPSEVRRVPVGSVRTGVWQPRRTFRAEPLDELVQSVRERGVLQPLLVRAAGDGFELIAGERRLRAAVAAGLAEVPVRLMAVSDREALELALIENLQREDLDPIEEAEGYRMLAERFQLTQEQVAERVGKGRASVANALRLLGLPDPVRSMIEDGRLSVGHAKVLLGLSIPLEMESLARQSVKEGWSVREIEKAVERIRRGPRRRRSAQSDVPAPHVKDIEERLKQKLGSAVRITPSRTLANGRKAKGRIEIEFYTGDDLDRLMLILGLTEEF